MNKNFLIGFESIFDLDHISNLKKYKNISKNRDKIALQNDWKNIGLDIYSAINKFKKHENIKK